MSPEFVITVMTDPDRGGQPWPFKHHQGCRPDCDEFLVVSASDRRPLCPGLVVSRGEQDREKPGRHHGDSAAGFSGCEPEPVATCNIRGALDQRTADLDRHRGTASRRGASSCSA